MKKVKQADVSNSSYVQNQPTTTQNQIAEKQKPLDIFFLYTQAIFIA